MSEGSRTYASASRRLSDFGSPPQTRLELAEVRCYLEEGLEGVERHQYPNPKSSGTAINRQIREFQLGGPAQYAVFNPVTDEEFTEIDKFATDTTRDSSSSSSPTKELKFSSMGLRRGLANLGRGRFSGLAGQKEGDTAFKPISRKYIRELANVANPNVTQTDPNSFITRATRTGGCKIVRKTVTGAPVKFRSRKPCFGTTKPLGKVILFSTRRTSRLQ
ncbi:hypothetical protein B9Z19DRAFT_1135794 [Tuber borchii]|uniref:Uncharacterized protein n=1 Tax=Tuber borchii TaxID=42251 RepID=A0A2T6ZCA4_TUBBO|nr:hypothetical protein B9Z19DRAFT_1135794 [Tuber borchii]